MYSLFRWTRGSWKRNELLRRYEPLQPFILSEFASRYRDVAFLDIGANIGAYSLFLSTWPEVSRIMAFEPSPKTAQILRGNISTNHLTDRIECFEIALSDVAESKQFTLISSTSGANAISQGSPRKKRKLGAKEITVRSAKLDTFDISQSHLVVKIDVEGHELQVIAGGSQLLAERIGVIQIEELEASGSRVSGALNAIGYIEVFSIGNDYYFSNDPHFQDDSLKVSIFESAIEKMIACNVGNVDAGLGDARPLRAAVAPGFSLEISGHVSRFLRKIMQRLRHR